MFADRYASSVNDIPAHEHWAIIRDCFVTIPGDERSRTAPGHGYPDHTEHYFSYEVYLTEEKMKDALLQLYRNRYPKSETFRGVHVIGSYSDEVTVKITKDVSHG